MHLTSPTKIVLNIDITGYFLPIKRLNSILIFVPEQIVVPLTKRTIVFDGTIFNSEHSLQNKD